MPIFEYKCAKCGHQFEELIFKDKKIKCPKCGSNSLEKLISNIGLVKNSDNSDYCSNGTCDVNCPTCKM